LEKHHFNVIVNDLVADEIQEAVDYYKEKQKSLGSRFYSAAKKALKSDPPATARFYLPWLSEPPRSREMASRGRGSNYPYQFHSILNYSNSITSILSNVPFSPN